MVLPTSMDVVPHSSLSSALSSHWAPGVLGCHWGLWVSILPSLRGFPASPLFTAPTLGDIQCSGLLKGSKGIVTLPWTPVGMLQVPLHPCPLCLSEHPHSRSSTFPQHCGNSCSGLFPGSRPIPGSHSCCFFSSSGLIPRLLGDILSLWLCNMLAYLINTYALENGVRAPCPARGGQGGLQGQSGGDRGLFWGGTSAAPSD